MNARLPPRGAIALATAIVVGLALGYALSWEPDEQAMFERAVRAREARRGEIMRQERAAELAQAEQMRVELAARQAAQAAARDSAAKAEREASCRPARVSPTSECVPVTIDDVAYIVEIEPREPGRGDYTTKRVRVHADSARVVYDEDGSSLAELSVRVLEDGGGRARGFLFKHIPPSSTGRGVFYQIVVPHAGAFRALTPPFNYGGFEPLTDPDPQFRRVRLAEGDRFFTGWQTRRHFNALTTYRVDFRCEPGAASCVALDSIHGLARFAQVEIEVDAEWQPVDSTVTIELFPAPRAGRSERVAIAPGTRMVVLEGAGRVTGDEQAQEDDWLHVTVNGRTGWIHGAHTFAAIFEVPKEYRRVGRPRSPSPD